MFLFKIPILDFSCCIELFMLWVLLIVTPMEIIKKVDLIPLCLWQKLDIPLLYLLMLMCRRGKNSLNTGINPFWIKLIKRQPFDFFPMRRLKWFFIVIYWNTLRKKTLWLILPLIQQEKVSAPVTRWMFFIHVFIIIRLEKSHLQLITSKYKYFYKK